jgi:hypothetical protein
MDLALFTRNRLKQLRLGPRNMARASRMTESYIAHLPAPNSPQTAAKRTDMDDDQLERVLKLSQGQLAKLADLQRGLEKQLENNRAPIFRRTAHHASE